MNSLLRHRWPLFVLAGTAATGVAVGALRVQSLVREQVPHLLQSRLEAALGRRVAFGALHVTPLGVWVDDLRVMRTSAEREDPLAARRLAIGLDWWQLLTTQQVRVSAVDLEGAKVRFAPPSGGPGGEPWSAQLVGFSRSGLERFGLRDASIHVLRGPRGPAVWSAEGVRGDLDLGAERFGYRAQLASLETGGQKFAKLRLAGTGDRDRVVLKEGSAAYEGVQFHARGTVKSADNAVDMTVRVQDLPLGRLAPRMGIPAQWAMQGSVTGEVTVDARNNALRSVRGTVSITRGWLAREGGRFPWSSASANVDWTPERALLRDVRVLGDGLSLTAAGEVALDPGKPFTAGRFRLSGDVRADRSEAVARIAEQVAFRKMLDGRWTAGGASVRFSAAGLVGNVNDASASGRLQITGLRFQPAPNGDWVHVATVESDLERSPERVVLRNLSARTEKLSLNGAVTVTNDRPGRPGAFEARGSVEAKDLRSLKETIPQASLWKWVPVVSSNAHGRVDFRIGGPMGNMAGLWSDGSFEVRDFRFGAQSSLPNGTTLFIPVNVARGSFRHADQRLTVTGLEFGAQTFDAEGEASIDFRQAEPLFASSLRLWTDDWRSLPAWSPTALPELTGGRFEGSLKVTGPLTRLSEIPVDGTFRLTNAVYTPGRSRPPVPVRELSARFHWEHRVLELPDVTLETPVVSANANGRLYRGETNEYRAALDITGNVPDTGVLVARFSDLVRLSGGAATARFHADTPVRDLSAVALDGTLQVTDAKLLHAVEPLGLKQVEARKVALNFAGSGSRFEVRDLKLDAPGLEVGLKGLVDNGRVEAEVHATASEWNAPAKLPVTGGAVRLEGRLAGDVKQPEAVQFAGALHVDGARLRYRSAKLAVNGGALKLTANGQGAVADPLAWLQSGEVSLTGPKVDFAGQDRTLDTASLQFTREGEGFRFRDARLATAGATATGTGLWTPAGLQVEGRLAGGDPSLLGLALPQGAALRGFSITGSLSGTPKQPVQAATGRLELDGVKFAYGGAPAQALDRLTGTVRLADGRVHVENLEGKGPAGTVTVNGEWAKERLQAKLLLAGDDFNKLGIKLADGFGVGAFRLEAEATGSPKQPAVAGTLLIKNARFPFGPTPQRIAQATSRLRLDGKRVLLSDVLIQGPVGLFRGEGEVSQAGYRLALQSPAASVDLVRWLLPGKVEGGALAGTLIIEGASKVPVRVVRGRFDSKDFRYTMPDVPGLEPAPLQVARLAGNYHWEDGRTVLTALELDSDLVDGKGSLSASAENGRLQGSLSTPDLGRIVDFMPMMAGQLRGGASEGRLDARFDAQGAHGTVALTAKGGTLFIPGAPAEFAEHPIETASGILAFEPNRLTFNDVKLRGPRGNADGEATWTVNGGPVYGKGKAWFSKSYTRKLLKPTGFGWLARLVGIREIKSDFTLSGTSDRVILNAAITKGLVWKFAKGRVPKEFQAIAAGKVPLWVKPEALAAAPK